MAIENAKTLNVRIKNKYDSYENWAASGLILEAGEIAIAYTTVNVEVGNGKIEQHPELLMKVGNGSDTFANLPWLSAKAADVAAWAKAANKPAYEAKEITGIDAYIADYVNDQMGISVDTDTQYQIVKVDDYNYKLQSKGKTDEVWADVANSAIVIPNDTDAIADAKKAGTDANDALEAYKTTNDAAVAKVAEDLAAEAEAARAAEKANSDAIAAIKDHESVDSFADVMAEIAKKQDSIPAETYDAYGAAAAVDAKLTTHAETAANTYETKDDASAKLTEAKGYTDTEVAKVQGEVDALETLVGTLPEGTDATTVVAYIDAKTANIASDETVGAIADRVKAIEDDYLVEADKTELSGAITTEKERAEGVEAGLQDAIDAINDETDGILAQAKAHADSKDEAIATAKQAGDDAMAEAQKRVASVTAADASVTIGGTSTAPTVAAKLSADADNALTLAEDGLKVVIPAAAEYSIVKAADSGDYAAVYNLTKDGAIVGASINIPKDMVVKSGSVVGDEIVLVLNDEAATEIKVPVASLIEYVTSGSATGDMVVVNVSDDHKVTATITDGTITLAKLTTEVQTAIGKAHSHENADVLAGINADKVAAWDAAQANAEATAAGALSAAKTELEGKIADAQAAAEKVANDNDTAMNARVEALEGKVDTGDQKVSEYVAVAIEALKIGDYAKAADLTAAIEQHNTDKVALETEIAKKANDADLADIAFSGSTDDLIQGELVLVFDCGNASV